jgi:hypothetical protein
LYYPYIQYPLGGINRPYGTYCPYGLFIRSWQAGFGPGA